MLPIDLQTCISKQMAELSIWLSGNSQSHIVRDNGPHIAAGFGGGRTQMRNHNKEMTWYDIRVCYQGQGKKTKLDGLDTMAYILLMVFGFYYSNKCDTNVARCL